MQSSSSHHLNMQSSSSHHLNMQSSSSHLLNMQSSSSHHLNMQSSSSHLLNMQSSSSHHLNMQSSSSHHLNMQSSSSHHLNMQSSSSSSTHLNTTYYNSNWTPLPPPSIVVYGDLPDDYMKEFRPNIPLNRENHLRNIAEVVDMNNKEDMEGLMKKLFDKKTVVISEETVPAVRLMALSLKENPSMQATVPEFKTLCVKHKAPVVEYLCEIIALLEFVGKKIELCEASLWQLCNYPVFKAAVIKALPSLKSVKLHSEDKQIGEMKLPRRLWAMISKDDVQIDYNKFKENGLDSLFVPYIFSGLWFVESVSCAFEQLGTGPVLIPWNLTQLAVKFKDPLCSRVGAHLELLPCQLNSISLDGPLTSELLRFLYKQRLTVRKLLISDFGQLEMDFMMYFPNIKLMTFGNKFSIWVVSEDGITLGNVFLDQVTHLQTLEESTMISTLGDFLNGLDLTASMLTYLLQSEETMCIISKQ